jgi:hypothetical protein
MPFIFHNGCMHDRAGVPPDVHGHGGQLGGRDGATTGGGSGKINPPPPPKKYIGEGAWLAKAFLCTKQNNHTQPLPPFMTPPHPCLHPPPPPPPPQMAFELGRFAARHGRAMGTQALGTFLSNRLYLHRLQPMYALNLVAGLDDQGEHGWFWLCLFWKGGEKMGGQDGGDGHTQTQSLP